jgi:hypothetical protein
MSVIGSATIALTTVVTVFAAAFPEVTNAVLPLLEDGNEYAAYCMGLLITIPGLMLLTVIASASRE